MQETEITVMVYNNLEDTCKILENQGFHLKEIKTMTDIYLSKFSIDQLKQMDYQEKLNNSIILRKFTYPTHEKSFLLYKNKTIDTSGNVLREEKSHCPIDNIEQANQILTKAGLTTWCELVQDMKIYKNDKMEFALQHIDQLGLFLEYEEDKSMAGMTDYQKINQMLSNLKSLGLNISNETSFKKVLMKFEKSRED